MTPLLSIIVISHEQREELRRCLDSIFAMQLPFAHEIIVSDDRSTDGTREMLEEIRNERMNGLKDERCKLVVTYCNSDKDNCATNSLRSGYNRCNAYPLAKGKYIAHVDADDYFRDGADVYIKQITALETHFEELSTDLLPCNKGIYQRKYGEMLIRNGENIYRYNYSFPIPKNKGDVVWWRRMFNSVMKGYVRRCFMNPVSFNKIYHNINIDTHRFVVSRFCAMVSNTF